MMDSPAILAPLLQPLIVARSCELKILGPN